VRLHCGEPAHVRTLLCRLRASFIRVMIIIIVFIIIIIIFIIIISTVWIRH
jgi:hypothetical protein